MKSTKMLHCSREICGLLCVRACMHVRVSSSCMCTLHQKCTTATSTVWTFGVRMEIWSLPQTLITSDMIFKCNLWYCFFIDLLHPAFLSLNKQTSLRTTIKPRSVLNDSLCVLALPVCLCLFVCLLANWSTSAFSICPAQKKKTFSQCCSLSLLLF